MLEIQDGSQITGSTNISETIHIIKIPTANLRYSTNGKLAESEPRRFQIWPTIKNGGRNRKYLYLWNYETYSPTTNVVFETL